MSAVEKAPLPCGFGGGNVVVKVTETEKGSGNRGFSRVKKRSLN